ncbi:alpha-hydroxy-acid oxidizing protein [Desulfocurvus sp.]|uniref:alpha-hydroxy-acid oxidizing protein n=1 Tax=Desulfocurvus sp. TaxID=2871698 RepID=UPI0025BF954D|nr:alpha-hydroxy-acid oxidizing protein [Desulfocurvus sp.]MCK9241539.1 alpha-hydroxy-acid oxidizing protein [Desulfocurvus sp.]
MKEVRDKARELMKGYCRVCSVCDGRACAGEVPGMGGLGSGASFKENIAALAGHKLRMRLIHGASEPDTRTTVLGLDLDIPVLAAPIGGVSFNMGGKIEEIDYITAKLEACAQEGIVGCTGDGVPAFIHEAGFAAIEKVGGRGIPFIKPWEDAEFDAKLDKAAATGATVFGMDIDAAGLVTLAKMGRPVSPKTPQKLAEIVEKVPGRFVLKGVMTVEDARLALEAGADAIVVSNHGGRVLDHAQGSASVLAEIAASVGGRMTVLADGGVRSGADVLKMLALGADAVMIGRPFSVAVMGGLKDGAAQYIRQIKSELVSAMVLTGCASVADAGPGILARA